MTSKFKPSRRHHRSQFAGKNSHDRCEGLRQLMATEVLNERKVGGTANRYDKEDAIKEEEQEGDDEEVGADIKRMKKNI